MKKLYGLLFILFLLPHTLIKTNNLSPIAEKLKGALSKVSTNKLEQEYKTLKKLSDTYPNQIWKSITVDPRKAGLEELQKKGIISRLKPSDNTKLHEWTYLCAHNAFSSKAHGYGLYKQQNLSMTEQLNRGARALMLDAWLANDVIRLTHGDPKWDKVLRGLAGTGFGLKLFQEGMHMEKELKKLKEEFFDKPENKGEVVFIILEDYINDRALMDKTLENSGLASKILQPSEWDPQKNNGWPTFKWMKDRNKQIVIFSDKGKTKYLYPQWQNMYENQYGNIDNVGAAQQRGSSEKYNKNKRDFYLFNFFKDYAEHAFADADNFLSGIDAVVKFINKLNFEDINSDKLEKAIDYSMTQGPRGIQGRYPNFIALDFVEQGIGLRVVDEINEKASKNPSYYYRPIQAQ